MSLLRYVVDRVVSQMGVLFGANGAKATRQHHLPPRPFGYQRFLLASIFVAIDVPNLERATGENTGMHLDGTAGDPEARQCAGRYSGTCSQWWVRGR